MTGPFAAQPNAPCRVRFDTVREQFDSGPTRAALVIYPDPTDPTRLAIQSQADNVMQSAGLIAAAIRWAVLNGVIGPAMQIVATSPLESHGMRALDASPPKPGEIPRDDLPPHLRGL